MTLLPHQQPQPGQSAQHPHTESPRPGPGPIPSQRQPEMTAPTTRQSSPAWQPMPPPAPTPTKRPVSPVIIAIAGVLVAFILSAGIVAAVTNGSSEPATPTATAPSVPAYTPPSAPSSTPSTPAAQPEPAPQSFKGSGDQVVRLATPLDYAVVSFECASCSGNVVVKADDALLVNEIGSYSGKTIYGLSGASASSPLNRLQVNAKGAWTMTVGGLSTARQLASFPVSGSGDDVLLVSNPADVATLSHDGKSNFAVWAATDNSGVDLVVNEIGRYNGTVILPYDSGAMLIAITADGNWTLK